MHEALQVESSPEPCLTDSTTSAGVSWVKLTRMRLEVERRWPSIWKLGVVTHPLQLVLRHAKVRSVLDVGATERLWEPDVLRMFPGAEYRSLDIDRSNPHDYYDFDEVPKQFDLVLCLEVLEHLTPAQGIDIMRRCAAACAPGGYVLISAPNVHAPWFQLDFTHTTALAVRDLGGLIKWSGLGLVDGARMCLAGRRRLLIHKYLLGLLHRAMNIDYCQSVAMLGRKDGTTT